MQKEIVFSTKELMNAVVDLVNGITVAGELQERTGGGLRWCERILDLRNEIREVNDGGYTLTEGRTSTFTK